MFSFFGTRPQSKNPPTKSYLHKTANNRRANTNRQIENLERPYAEALTAIKGTHRQSKRSKYNSRIIPRTPSIDRKAWATGVEIEAQSERIAETEGQIERIDEQLDSGTAKGRDGMKLKKAREELKSYVKNTRAHLKKKGATRAQLYPEPVPMGHAFDPIRNGNGEVEHYVVYGSSRAPQTGIGKAVGDAGLDATDFFQSAFNGIAAFIAYLPLLLLILILVLVLSFASTVATNIGVVRTGQSAANSFTRSIIQ